LRAPPSHPKAGDLARADRGRNRTDRRDIQDRSTRELVKRDDRPENPRRSRRPMLD
jgi:hypothetical protein